MASVRNIGLTNDDKIGQNERSQPSLMAENASSNPIKTPSRDSYWFAHGGVEEVVSKNAQSSSKSPGAGDSKDAQLQKDKAERIKMFHEQQEEERLKKLKDLEQQFLQAKKHRELQEEERKRRIEEARIKEMERRQQVEERKRQIWEAEQERKEAILRRNMEREARIEARRNAQRNSQCFAFGSSTPRTFDLDLAAIGAGRNSGPGLVLMSSVSGRRSEEREIGPPRATSACSLDRKFDTFYNADYSNDQRDPSRSASLEPSLIQFSNISKQIAFLHKSSNDMKACLSMWDSSSQRCENSFDSLSPGWLMGSGVTVGEDCMSRSMVSLSSSAFRGRKRTDIVPTLTRERSITPHVTPRGKDTSRSPSRPQSSMSGASELSATSSSISAVNMRARSAPRRPRPYSIAGSSTERTPIIQKKEPDRQSRQAEKEVHSSAPKQARAKSIGHEKIEEISRPKKPLPPPKSKEVLARAKSHPVPIKDNLRKTVKSSTHSDSKKNGEKNVENEENINVENKENIQSKAVKALKEAEIMTEIVNSSPVTSPVTDSEMCISSEDSRIMTESDLNSYNQTESDFRSESINISTKKGDVLEETASNRENLSPEVDQCVSENISSAVAEQQILKSGAIPEGRTNQGSEEIVTEQKFVNESNIIVAEQKSVEVINTGVPEQELVKENSVTEQKSVNESNAAEQQSTKVINTDVSEQKLVNENNSVEQESVDEYNATEQQSNNDVNLGVTEDKTTSESENLAMKENVVQQKPKITSEEEARAALAEKRRLAREKAEREAELERQRQEELKRQEEEQRRLEELEQKKMEEEQIRLAELHRQLEAEKLQKAIDEQKKREQEERELREEEARQKAEKEEQERKAREEAERQRLELAERLKKEEEERAERKRRVEQIMARTRGKSNAPSPASTPSDSGNKSLRTEATTPTSTLEKIKNSLLSPAQDTSKANHILNGSSMKNSPMSTSFTSNSSDNPFETLGEYDMSKSYPLPDLLNSDAISNHCSKSNGHHDESSTQLLSSSISESKSFSSNRSTSANDALSPTQTNGYSSHEDMSCTTSPEETSDGILINVESSPQSEVKAITDSSEFTRLIDIDQSSLNLNENYVISADKVNSNIMSTEKSYTNLQKTDAHVVDLLS